jgi:hypothetical protein
VDNIYKERQALISSSVRSAPIHTANMSSAVSPADQIQNAQTTLEQRPTWKERWIPRLKLMAGLLFPTFLETLDYTGMPVTFLDE